MELTELQKLLIACFKAYGMDMDETVCVMLILDKEEMQNEMLNWIKQNTSAPKEDLLMKVMSICRQYPESNDSKD